MSRVDKKTGKRVNFINFKRFSFLYRFSFYCFCFIDPDQYLNLLPYDVIGLRYISRYSFSAFAVTSLYP